MANNAGHAEPATAGKQWANNVDIKAFIDGRPISAFQ